MSSLRVKFKGYRYGSSLWPEFTSGVYVLNLLVEFTG